jgi:hypothetical protein
MLISNYASSLVIALPLLWRMEVYQKASTARGTSPCQHMIPLVSQLNKKHLNLASLTAQTVSVYMLILLLLT